MVRWLASPVGAGLQVVDAGVEVEDGVGAVWPDEAPPVDEEVDEFVHPDGGEAERGLLFGDEGRDESGVVFGETALGKGAVDGTVRIDWLDQMESPVFLGWCGG